MATKEIKIILSGLDNAGKSSLLVALQNMYDFEDKINLLKPTIRIDYFHRNFLDMHLNFLDMGGQEKYRERYIKRPEYFDELDILIYLIDIQDEERFQTSIRYLEGVLNTLTQIDYLETNNNPIYISFSKLDGEEYESSKDIYQSRIKMLRNLIATKFQKFNFIFYQTTIYSIFSIAHLISNTLKPFNSNHNSLEKIISTYVNKYQIEYCSLFENTGLLIAEKSLKDYDLTQPIDDSHFKYDFIISNYLGFTGVLKDENVDINANYSYEAGFLNILYQFTIEKEKTFRSIDEEDLENKSLIQKELRKYFVSIIINKETNIDYEAEIPIVIDLLRDKLEKM